MGRPDPADPYSLLGLDRAATDAEIRRAFRRLARLAHPDAGGDRERFVALRRALDVLTDPEARARLDQRAGGAAAAGESRRASTPEASLAALAARLRAQWPTAEVSWRLAADGVVPLGDGRGFAATMDGHPQPPPDHPPVPAAGGEPAVVAVAADDGALRWRAGLAAASVCAPAVLGDLVVVVTADGVVHGLEVADGATRWERRLATEPTSSVAHGGVVVVASGDALSAVRATGEVAWVVRPHGGVADVAPGGPVVVVRSGAGAVIGIDPRTGATRWWLRVGSPWEYPPVVAGGWLWLPEAGADGGSGRRLVGVDPRSGGASHTLRCPAPVRSIHGVGGLLVVRDVERGLTAVHSGRPLWRMVVPTTVSTPASVPEAVVVATADGALRFLSARHGDEVHQVTVELPGGAPTSLEVADGLVVVGSASGGVVAHRVVTPAGEAPPR